MTSESLQAYPVLLRQGDALYLAGQEVEELSRTLERLRADYAALEAEHATKNETMVEQHHQSTADALQRAEVEHTGACVDNPTCAHQLCR